ncbi:MAG: methyltransferase domain-containing protein [Desulfobulbaceae bacterium]|jgi:spermidine synthase|nr:methyltransferase domain-containing protein [Desulfobulbaceae bacterium]
MPTPRLLYRHADNGFLIEVIEEAGTRSLYFSGRHLQSRQWLENPAKLLLPYTWYMMAFPLTGAADPKRALMIGVGAGSMALFLRQHFPECHIDAVDISQTILDVARDFFGLHEDDSLSIHCQDGGQFLRQSDAFYDLILLDAFDGDGMAEDLYCAPFFNQAKNHLSADGILCCNLWSNQAAKGRGIVRQLRGSFVDTIFLPVPERANTISLSATSAMPWRETYADRKRLAGLTDRFGLDFFTMAEVALRHNGGDGPIGFWRCLLRG